MVLLLTTWFGAFLVEGDRVVAQRLFPQEPQAIADRLRTVEEWKPLEEERQLVQGLPEYFVAEPRLERMGGNMLEGRPPFLDPATFGYDRRLLHDAMVLVSQARMRRAVGPDDHIIQAVRTMTDLEDTSNLLMARLRDWYALHFPELHRTVPEERFLDMIASHGSRDRMPGGPWESVGADLGDEERVRMMALARLVQEVRGRQAAMASYLDASMGDTAPNLRRLVGPVVGARLVAHAGGLRELALLPASTIQLLGAETALFRHLRTGAKPPKHGVIFQHPAIHQAAPWQRGPLARVLAARISIAARADALTRRDLGDELRRSFDQAAARARARHAAPRRKAQGVRGGPDRGTRFKGRARRRK